MLKTTAMGVRFAHWTDLCCHTKNGFALSACVTTRVATKQPISCGGRQGSCCLDICDICGLLTYYHCNHCMCGTRKQPVHMTIDIALSFMMINPINTATSCWVLTGQGALTEARHIIGGEASWMADHHLRHLCKLIASCLVIMLKSAPITSHFHPEKWGALLMHPGANTRPECPNMYTHLFPVNSAASKRATMFIPPSCDHWRNQHCLSP